MALAVVLAVATLMPACSGSATNHRTTVLNVTMTKDWVTPPFLDAVREFEQSHRNVRIDVNTTSIGTMTDTVRAGISSGSPPDVVQSHAHSGAGQKLALPLDGLWRKYKVDASQFLPGAVEDVTWAGHRYGIPLDSNAMSILYNVDEFNAAGVQPPGGAMSFGDFEHLAQALTSPDGSRRGYVMPTDDDWVTYGWIKANGGEVVEVGADARPRFSFDDPAVVDTLVFLQHLVDAGWAFGPVGPDGQPADEYALFRSGAAAMYATGSWNLVKVMKEVPAGHFGVMPMPHGLSGTTVGTAMGGSSLWIPVGARHPDLAFQFMLLLGSDHYAKRFAKEEGRLPVRPRVLADPYFTDPTLKVFVDELSVAHTPILGALNGASDAFEDALIQVFEHDANPRVVLAETEAKAASTVGPP